MDLFFKCPNCSEDLNAYFFDEYEVDRVHCKCGCSWFCLRPQAIIPED